MPRGLFTSLYQAGQPFALIDTRERREYVNGHWFGSTNIPLSALTPKVTRLLPNKEFPIHLLDWQDAVSAAAEKRLSELGYAHVKTCQTSVPADYGDGFVKGEYVWSKAFGEVVAHTCGLPGVTPSEYLASYRNAQLFDVRPTAEYAQFTIPDSQSLPNSLLLANLEALRQSGNMALLHCAGRTRSIIGACTLKAAGYNGTFAILKGGTQAWQLEGFEREFNASRLFATETVNDKPVNAFLNKWNISFQRLDATHLDSFIDSHKTHHLFDVSDDAATGQFAIHNIIRVSGTNLIQQTDQSIARYHVPVVLFDQGSGSRAAFAAYWLQAMGLKVNVVILTETLAALPPQPRSDCPHSSYADVSVEDLLALQSSSTQLLDFRPSKDFCTAHICGSNWGNIGEILQRPEADDNRIAVIGTHDAHAVETADLLRQHGRQIAGIYGWNTEALNHTVLQSTELDSPIDQSALFAGRHHGNLQDSRDYLAWEEELPNQIDRAIHHMWLNTLGQSTA